MVIPAASSFASILAYNNATMMESLVAMKCKLEELDVTDSDTVVNAIRLSSLNNDMKRHRDDVSWISRTTDEMYRGCYIFKTCRRTCQSPTQHHLLALCLSATSAAPLLLSRCF